MNIAFALLAEQALAHSTDGKVYITGGGIRTLTLNALPVAYPHLALVLGIELDGPELDVDHRLRIETNDPSGQPFGGAVDLTFRVALGAAPDGYVQLVSNMNHLSFTAPGQYAFEIGIDGKDFKTLSLRVLLSSKVGGESESTAVETQRLLGSGYAAFSRKEIDEAERFFREAVAVAPSLPQGHNNLGFVLLARGNASEALASFAEARRLGYPQNEITDANVGCGYYILGEPARSLEVFFDCLRTHVFRGPATLFGIDGEALFSVQLEAAAEYVALMTLNAAWSAIKARDGAQSRRLAEAANLSQPFANASGAAAFAASSANLAEALARIAPEARGSELGT